LVGHGARLNAATQSGKEFSSHRFALMKHRHGIHPFQSASNDQFSVSVLIRVHLWLSLCFIPLEMTLAGEPLAKGIQDNSFLVEEAYNQEAGVIQHIINVPIFFTGSSHEITPSFTQEWPVFSQTHQLSYSVPYTFTENDNGFQDIRLNYRFQALMENERTPAFAPRLSLVLPAGDRDKGFGVGRVGYETNLPFSKIVSDRGTVHVNAGMSIFPDVRGHDLLNYNLGASAIFAISRDFNLMLETVAGWNEDVDLAAGARSAKAAPARRVERNTTVLISPGARYAINRPGDLQIVVGAAVPIGLTSDSPDWGLFFYLSFEHPFMRAGK
jgi:hypothetical protein